MDTPTTAIGPGLGAFVAFFVLALLLWLLMRNMNGRMRRMAYAERDRVAKLEAQDQARAATDSGDRPPDPTAPEHPGEPDPRGPSGS
ncbi:MAG: hypothetical protein ABI083_16835 [Lapillicoccus sp.]